jgi:hypothetical protein
MGAQGSKQSEYERDTWPDLASLAQNRPDAGIHFQGNRSCPTLIKSSVKIVQMR